MRTGQKEEIENTQESVESQNNAKTESLYGVLPADIA